MCIRDREKGLRFNNLICVNDRSFYSEAVFTANRIWLTHEQIAVSYTHLFLRKGVSKEHRPNPIVQMGLFMDNQGIPITYEFFPGNTNAVSYTHLDVYKRQGNGSVLLLRIPVAAWIYNIP